MKGSKYPSINGLRAISILLVILSHLGKEKHNVFKDLYAIKWLNPFIYFFTDGGIGVNVFFVISGFLITSLMIKEEVHSQTISLKQFYIRRTLRIFPAYFFLLAVYAIIQLLGYIYISPSSWLTAVTYTKYFNWWNDEYTDHAWSLSIEEHFYLLWPLIFLMGNKARKAIGFCLILLVPIIRVITYFHPVWWIGELTIFYRIDTIAIGCLCALYKDELLHKLRPYWSWLFYASLLGMILLKFVPVFTTKHNINLNVFFVPFGKTSGTLANAFIAIIMMYSVFNTNGIWFKLLNSRLLNYIGVLSYSLYLWQEFFIFVPFCDNMYPFNIVCIPFAAMFSYYVIEKPFLTLKNRFQ